MFKGQGWGEKRAPDVCVDAESHDTLEVYCEGTVFFPLKGHPVRHFTMFCPQKGQPRGHFITFFSPLVGQPREHFIMSLHWKGTLEGTFAAFFQTWGRGPPVDVTLSCRNLTY